MNTLLRKEMRLLTPAWLVALVVSTSPAWWRWDDLAIPLMAFCLAVLFLALAPFGKEIGCGTLGLLLAQPERRLRFWTVKVGLVAVALASAWVVLGISGWVCAYRAEGFGYPDQRDVGYVLRLGALMALLAFAGGLWTTLLFRNVATAFWSTILVPGLICSVAMIPLSRTENWDLIEGVLAVVFLPYVLGAFWLGRRLFLAAQDTPWSGAQVALPQVRGLRLLSLGANRRRGPWTTLLRKELQLQSGTLALVPWLVLLHLGTLLLRHYAPQFGTDRSAFKLTPLIWMVVPIVLGCTSVAEERRLNTLEGHLCLPVRKRAQFAVKLAVALVLGTVFGGVVPWLLESMSNPEFEPTILCIVAAALTGAAFFASTMSRGILQAASIFLCIPVAVGIAVGAATSFVGGWLWVWEIPVIPWLLVALVVTWRAYRNYQYPQIGGWVWRANLGTAALLASVCLVPAAIHQRPWEYFMSLEPTHAAARLSAGRPGEIGQTYSNVFVLLPDGRLWGGQLVHLPGSCVINRLGFLPSSNWTRLAVSPERGTVAVKSDGTLWYISHHLELAQIGAESDWKDVAAGESYFLAVKQNGTLWGWGHDSYGVIDPASPTTREISSPIQLGSDSDWTTIYMVDPQRRIMATKRDGRLVRWVEAASATRSSSRYIARVNPILTTMAGTNWKSLTHDGVTTLGVRSDGSLWAEGSIPPKLLGGDGPVGFYNKFVQICTNSSWVSVSLGLDKFVALKADGTLWTAKEEDRQCARLSKYADWIVASADWQGTWALAKDGTLCDWPDYLNRPDLEEHEMFRPTRRATAINIFDTR